MSRMSKSSSNSNKTHSTFTFLSLDLTCSLRQLESFFEVEKGLRKLQLFLFFVFRVTHATITFIRAQSSDVLINIHYDFTFKGN